MNLPYDFNYYIKKGIARKQSSNIPRADFLISESVKSLKGLKERVEKIGINENNANSILKDIHDIIFEKIRAKLFIDGYSCSGNFAHEAEVAYMKQLGFSEYDVSTVNALRQARNGINYYGKIFSKTYADFCYKFLIELEPKLNNLFKR